MKEEFEQHWHNLHKEAVVALKETAKIMGITYGAAKQRFTIEQDVEVTEKFWEVFYSKNDVDAMGIDYCRGCKKFNVYIR